MRKYLYFAKSQLLSWMVYRVGFIFTILSNIVFIFITYYLWKSIYAEPGKILNGMPFEQTFLYLALASTLHTIFQTDTDWNMGRRIVTGNIVSDLVKPMDFQMQLLARTSGLMVSRLILLSIPALRVIIFVFNANIPVGVNLIFFFSSVILSFLLNFFFDFIIGTVSFYTQSTWGIVYTKNVIVMLLSGAAIPISFFPSTLQGIIKFLPFQYIYNAPLEILTSGKMNIGLYFEMILVQLLWLVAIYILGRLFYSKSLKVITVNGG